MEVLTSQFIPTNSPAVGQQESIINDAPKLHADFPVGSVACQGDLLFVAIDKLPSSATPRKNRQLAIGSTMGSRHIAARGNVYDCNHDAVRKAIQEATGKIVASDLIGPVFVSPADPTESDITHPEHGDQGFPACTVVAVVYQRSWDAEQREARRVAD